MEMIWNHDQTICFDPCDIRRYEIISPGKRDYSQPGNKTLSKYQIELIPYELGRIFYGRYKAKRLALVEVERLKRLRKQKEDRIMDWRKLSNGVHNWKELDDNQCCESDMVIVLYGQGRDHSCMMVRLAVGVLKDKVTRKDGNYNWQMGKHFLFQPDPHYDGYAPEYVIHPPQKGEGRYCPAGFQSFTKFSYDELRKGLRILGYKDKAIKRAVYAVECVFGNI